MQHALSERAPAGRRKRPWAALAWIALVAVLALASVWPILDAAFAQVAEPTIVLAEAFAPGDPAITFDHGDFDRLLRSLVDADGYVDYGRLYDDPRALDAYLTRLATTDLDALGRDEVLALLINAFNACTLRLVVDHWPLASVQAIPEPDRWESRRWVVGGRVMSLAELEADWLRAKFVEPRVHFAIVHGCVDSPPLRGEAYVGSRIDSQLADQMGRIRGSERWFRFDPQSGQLQLTPIYLAAAADFQQAAGTLLAFVRRWSPELDAWCASHGTPSVTWLEHDWRLNGIEHRPG